MIKTLRLLFLILIFLPVSIYATHNRAGEITYEHITGFTYRITVTTYTNEQAVAADRCALDVFFGDGTSQTVSRSNGGVGGGCTNGCQHCGVSIGGNTKLNIYVVDHTYPSTGSYRITMADPNRNEGVINIPNSVEVVFFLYSELNIFPGGIPNSSPILTNPPVDDACRNMEYKHNPGAVDLDISKNGLSDSLSYKLVSCKGNGGTDIPGYLFPDEIVPGANNIIKIDSVTGTLTWNSPKKTGEYNVAILIEEWRKIGNTVTKIGSILRDLQITVDDCNQNSPPIIHAVNDTCINASQFLLKKIPAHDPDNGQTVEISATGDPFYVQGNKATFHPKTSNSVVTQNFTWLTQCNHIRNYPYFVVFRAEDNAPNVHLTDYLDWRIKVTAPAPTGIYSQPNGSSIRVSWGYQNCTNATGFRVYRKMDSIGYVAPICETGIPSATGYKLIGSTLGASSTNFTDDGSGTGLIIGQKYCYMVYAYFDDGAESYPSIESCTTLRKEVPIITRVSVNNTDLSNGSDTIKWSKPTEINTQKYPGPYQYKILRKEPGTSYSIISTSILSTDLNQLDTIYINTNLNTQEIQYTYRIEIYNKDSLIGPSHPATSPFLKSKPLDNRLELSLNINVPWKNNTMLVYRQKTDGSFKYLDSTNASLIYTDSNLINGKEYCYYITTIGGYSDPELEHPLINHSQIHCSTPIDKQAPCPPQNLDIISECELFFNNLSWLNPNDICDTTDDVTHYNVYFKPIEKDSFKIIHEEFGAQNTNILFDNLSSVAGCYAITAIDSFNNESEMSNIVCVDNCPFYELPNIFTPGEDGVNDTFMPMPNWRYVKEVDMRIYNRWGEEVYTTSNPALGWLGNNKQGYILPNGVYYYVCVVHEIRLQGIVEKILKGNVTLLREEPGKPSN